MFILNTNIFLDLVWPIIFEWANIHSYILPDKDYMDSITVKRAESIPCAIPGSITTGQHDRIKRQIKILFPTRSKKQKMLTLVHEYAHAIQYYNLNDNFDINI